MSVEHFSHRSSPTCAAEILNCDFGRHTVATCDAASHFLQRRAGSVSFPPALAGASITASQLGQATFATEYFTQKFDLQWWHVISMVDPWPFSGRNEQTRSPISTNLVAAGAAFCLAGRHQVSIVADRVLNYWGWTDRA